MTYNDFLANRVRKAFANKNAAYTETVSFGQLNFLVNDCFCAGVNGEELEIHISPDKVARGLHGRKFRRLDESGRHLRGFIALGADELACDERLEEWISLALDYNRYVLANRGVSRGAARAFLCRFPVFVRVGVSRFAGALRIAPVLFPIVFRLSPGIPGPFPCFSGLFSGYV